MDAMSDTRVPGLFWETRGTRDLIRTGFSSAPDRPTGFCQPAHACRGQLGTFLGSFYLYRSFRGIVCLVPTKIEECPFVSKLNLSYRLVKDSPEDGGVFLFQCLE